MTSLSYVGAVGSEVRDLKLSAAPVPIEWNAGLPVYASEAFLKSEGGEFGWVGGIDESAKVRCILPYSILRKPGLSMVRFRTQTISLGRELELGEEKLFLRAVVEHFRSTRADIIIPSGNTAIFSAYPDGAAAAPYGTFVNDLSQSEEALLAGVRKSYRQNIRKAVSAGVQIKTGPEYLDIAYKLVAETMARSSESFKSYEDFKRKVLGFGEYVKIFVAEFQGEIHGCMVAPFSGHTAYDCYAGSKPKPVLGAMHLLHWEAIRQFRVMGVKLFDFQGVRINPEPGSKQEGIMHYKQGFGGKLVQGFQWKYPLRPLKAIAYNMAVRVLLGGDIVDRESSKLQHA